MESRKPASKGGLDKHRLPKVFGRPRVANMYMQFINAHLIYYYAACLQTRSSVLGAPFCSQMPLNLFTLIDPARLHASKGKHA